MKRYRQYLRDEERDIPRTTLNRWKFKKTDDGACSIHDDVETASDEDHRNERESIRQPSQSDADSISSEQCSDNSGISDDERMSSADEYICEDETVDPKWFTQALYAGCQHTVGESVEMILDYYLKNALSKKSLENLLQMLAVLLPQPNFLPKSKYFLSKLLEPLITSHTIMKHRFCNKCSYYLGDWFKDSVKICLACESTDVGGMFVEYDIRSVLVDAFETRNLDTYIEMHAQSGNNDGDEYITDVTTGSEYKKLKNQAIPSEYDILIIWNTDGFPTANSSSGQVWAIQIQIVNIPPCHRRDFQFVCGLHYSTIAKPNMNSFLKPFAKAVKDLYVNGIDWHQKRTGLIRHSKVVASIATLDCPARAVVQNIAQFNGLYGCSFCEHPGQTCKTRSGSNHVYPILDNEPPMRNKETMLLQASQAVNVDDHIKGVKGPTIVATMPFFDVAISFVPDYMHAVLLGVMRMLINCWCNSKNKDRPFYIKKSLRDQIDERLQEIKAPDVVSRTPRPLKYFKFWKASELRAFLLFYSPILLIDKLSMPYYQHYLLLVRAIQILIQCRIHVNEIDLAESLLYLFVADIKDLYGLEKCSFNIHQLTHLARFVRYWGPLWGWSTFPFEDGNGYLLRITHGPNKIDVEILNTLKFVNALQILKHRLRLFPTASRPQLCIALGSPVKILLRDAELLALQNVPYFIPEDIDTGRTHVYTRVKVGNEVFTSKLYYRQRKRDNYYITWNNGLMLGAIRFFIRIDETFFAIVQIFVDETDRNYSFVHKDTEMSFDAFIKPIRSTYCVQVIPVNRIEGKFLRVSNYACIFPNSIEKKL